MLRQIALLFVAAVILALGAPCFAAELLVPSEYPTIQAAIDAAAQGDAVIIAPGTYTGDGNRDIDFKGKVITVRSTDPNGPNIVAATVIDCEQQGRGFYLDGCAGAAISGLTITNGWADAGGAIYCKDSSVTISQCRIVDNATTDGAETNDPNGGPGGAVYWESSSGTIEHCTISNNSTGTGSVLQGSWEYLFEGGRGGDGAGIYCASSSSLVIYNSQIRENRTGQGGEASTYDWNGGDGGRGGGIFVAGFCSLELTDCKLADNTAGDGARGEGGLGGHGGAGGDGGGIFAKDSCSLSVLRTLILDNRAGNGAQGDPHSGGKGGNGGGLCATGSCIVQIIDSTASGNIAGNGRAGRAFGGGAGGDGGAISIDDSSSLTVCSSSIIGNRAGHGGLGNSDDGGRGGGGGGIYCGGSSSVVIRDSIVSKNRAGEGGEGNDATGVGGTGGNGGALYCDESSSLDIRGSEIADNMAGGGAYPDGAGGKGGAVFCISSLPLKLAGCCVSGNSSGGNAGEHNWAGGQGGHGGGIYCSSAVIENSTISDNSAADGGPDPDHARAGGDGGGIYCEDSLELLYCTLSNNSSGKGGDSFSWGGGSGGDGGGVWVTSLTAARCKIADNETGSGGYGGIHGANSDAGYGGAVYCTEVFLVSCEVTNNKTGNGGAGASTAGNGGKGAGLFCSGHADVTDSVFLANATGSGGQQSMGCGDGGAGGAIYCDSAIVTNCLIAGNTTGDGGSLMCGSPGRAGNGAGLYLYSASSLSEIKNGTIADNSVGRGDFGAAPVSTGGSVFGNTYTIVMDSIIWGNEPDGIFGVDCNNVSYCDVQDANFAGGTGNISADPLFVRAGQLVHTRDQSIIVDPADPEARWVGDYRLSHVATGQQADSPCIDAGSDLAENMELGELTTRTDGIADAGTVDIGFHYDGPTPADADADRDVDWADYAFLAEHWLCDVNWPAYYAGPAELEKVDLARIPKGIAVVDGSIGRGEWPSLYEERVTLGNVYYGEPADVRGAHYSLRWDPATSKLYMAARVWDRERVFSDEYIRWDASDRIEIYVQAVPEGGTDWPRVYDVAQQYMIGPNTNGGHWATWAYGEQVAEDVGLESAVWISGSYIYYEVAIPLFDYYGGISGGETVGSVLEPGRIIGFDVIVSSRDDSGGFGMLSDNMMTGKSQDAGQFAKRVLSSPRLYLPEGGYEVDLNYDGVVDWHDLALLLDSWLRP